MMTNLTLCPKEGCFNKLFPSFRPAPPPLSPQVKRQNLLCGLKIFLCAPKRGRAANHAVDLYDQIFGGEQRARVS